MHVDRYREPLSAPRGIAQMYDDIRDGSTRYDPDRLILLLIDRVERRLSGSSAVRIVS